MALDFGDPVKVTPPFVSLSGAKVGADPGATFHAQFVCIMLGGVWNATHKHTDKRRWVVVEREEH
eukprot:1640410-Pleurochrysis_carterae.AAC.1